MKRIIFCLFVLFILIQSDDSQAWDTTAAKFYPINLGNTYIHKKEHYDFFCVILVNTQYFRVKITSDTIMPNGKKYFKFDGYDYFSSWNYQRIDSNSMNVYGYINGYEILLDSLLGRVDDFFSGKRNFNSVFAKVDGKINNFLLFGSPRNAKIILNNSSELFFSYYLVENFGLGYMVVCTEDSGYIFSTLGCVINGVVYGDTALTGVSQINSSTPENFSLSQNYPNPFNPNTVINYSIPSNVKGQTSNVKLVIYNATGQEVATLVNQKQNAGSYEVEFNGEGLPSGIYFYRIAVHSDKLESGNFSDTKRMILLK